MGHFGEILHQKSHMKSRYYLTKLPLKFYGSMMQGVEDQSDNVSSRYAVSLNTGFFTKETQLNTIWSKMPTIGRTY